MQVPQPYNITSKRDCQEHLSDTKALSRALARKLAMIGEEAGDRTLISAADRMYSCGDVAIMRHFESGEKQLAGAVLCKGRWCPTCQWRRARKEAAQLSGSMAYAEQQSKCAWIALSYSPRACADIADAAESIERLLKGWAKLWRKMPPSIIGAFRALEVRQSDGAVRAYAKGWWQPHIHAILQVNPSYFHSRDYISLEKWRKLICECTGCDTVQVHIEKLSDERRAGSATETAKYIVKPGQSILDVPDKQIYALYKCLYHRRLHSYYGKLKAAHAYLYASDDASADDADLINGVDEPVSATIRYWYEWLKYIDGRYVALDVEKEYSGLTVKLAAKLAEEDPEHREELIPWEIW